MSVLKTCSCGFPIPPLLPGCLLLPIAPCPIFKQPLHGKWEIPPLSAADADAPRGFGIVQGQ